LTLLELVVVMTILVIVLGAVAPSLAGFLRGSQLRSLLRQVSSQFLYARNYAVSNGLLVRVSWDRDQQALELEAERDPAERPGEFERVRVSSLGRIVFPEDMEIADLEVNGESNGETEVYFFPDGHTDSALVSIVHRDKEYSVEMAPLTGRVEVKDASGQGFR
jgi:Tfp pilus assembly protein FimT